MIKGFQGVSLIDYPNHISSIVFIGGCNLRCIFCQNRELVLPEELKKLKDLSEDFIFGELKKREGFIDGVEFTGGEPTLYKNLIPFIERIKKETDLDIKIDTNGTNPGILKTLIENSLVDYVAMDIKTTPERYSEIVGVKVNIGVIGESVEIIKSGKTDYEFRTTLVPEFVGEKEIMDICKFLGRVRRYVLQRFRIKKTLKPMNVKPYTEEEMRKILSCVYCAKEKILR